MIEIHLLKSILRPFSRVTPPGTGPGVVVAVPDEPKPVISVMAFTDGELYEDTIESVDEMKALTEKYAVTWINIDGLGDAEMIRQIGEKFGLHTLALEDVVNVHQRPKVEDYGDYLFIVARMVDFTEQLQTEQICFFLGDNFLLTFQEGKPGDCLDPVRERIRKSSKRLRHGGTDYLAYALLDSIIDHYFPIVEYYGEKLDELDDELINSRGNASVASVHAYRSELLMLRRTIRPHREALNQLLRGSHQLINDETLLFLRDCYDHTIQLGDAIDVYREVCSDLRDFHLATIGNRTNDVMKTLTIIATIFIPLNFIAAFYGMNFDDLPGIRSKYGYIFALNLMGFFVAGLLLWFNRKGWFFRS